MEKVRAHILISGRVQGVCFRAATEEEAKLRGMTGWVRNTEDGRVEATFEGDRTDVEAMIEWCRRGPPAARVTDLQVGFEPYRGSFPDFRISHQRD